MHRQPRPAIFPRRSAVAAMLHDAQTGASVSAIDEE
jgi:hypothetical protein